MAIVAIGRWKAPNAQLIIEAAKNSKPFWLSQGAIDVQLAQMHTGSNVGEWVLAVTFKSLEAYGKAATAVGKLIGAGATLLARDLLVGVDL